MTTLTGAHLEATPEESQAFQNIQNELDPGRQFEMAIEFEKTYPNSHVLSYVYTQLAKAYEKKGEFEKVIESCEKSLKLDPDNLLSLIVVSMNLAQPRMLKGTAVENGKGCWKRRITRAGR